MLTKLFIDLFLMGPSITATFFMWNQLAEKGLGGFQGAFQGVFQDALENTKVKVRLPPSTLLRYAVQSDIFLSTIVDYQGQFYVLSAFSKILQKTFHSHHSHHLHPPDLLC